MVEANPELSSDSELFSDLELPSDVEFKQLANNIPIPYFTGEGCYIQSFLPVPEKIFSNKEKEDFCKVVNDLKANYFATKYKVMTFWKEKGEENSSLDQIYVDAGDGRCGPCMHFGETLEISNTKRAIHILFFQEVLAIYHQFQGIFYPYIKSERRGDLTEFSFETDGPTKRELVDIDKNFGGEQILESFIYYVMQKRKGKEFNK